MKKTLKVSGMLVSLVVLFLLSSFSVSASTAKEININVDGKVIKDSSAFIQMDRVWVPLRVVAETIGCKVDWDGDTQTISLTKEGMDNVELYINAPYGLIGKYRQFSVIEPQLLNGRTYVALRFIAEGLGKKVAWDGETRTVQITSAEPPVITITPVGGFITSDSKISINATSIFGIQGIWYCWDNGNFTKLKFNETITPPTAPGMHTLKFFAKDNSPLHNRSAIYSANYTIPK